MNLADTIKRFPKKDSVIRAKELKRFGLSYYNIRELIHAGRLEKVNRGVYRLTDRQYDEKTEVSRLIPSGVFCLFTACLHYELSTFVSSELHVAIPKSAKYILPAYPPVKLYYWDTKSYQTGIATVQTSGVTVRMYDLEKTVCDIMRLRNKVGLDIAKEVMKNYVKRKDRDLVKLLKYARVLRVETTIKTYLEILL